MATHNTILIVTATQPFARFTMAETLRCSCGRLGLVNAVQVSGRMFDRMHRAGQLTPGAEVRLGLGGGQPQAYTVVAGGVGDFPEVGVHPEWDEGGSDREYACHRCLDDDREREWHQLDAARAERLTTGDTLASGELLGTVIGVVSAGGRPHMIVTLWDDGVVGATHPHDMGDWRALED